MTTPILAIDPGPERSAWVEYDPGPHRVLNCDIEENQFVLARLARTWPGHWRLVIEWVCCYGMPVGAPTFDMVRWIGRFHEVWGEPEYMTHPEAKIILCNSPKAKDPHIRQALIDRFPASGGGKIGQVGTVKSPGPLYGVKSHIWSALAVAVAWDEQQNGGKRRYDGLRSTA